MTNTTGTKLTAVEEIQAAIDELNQMRDAAPSAPWDYIDDEDGYSIRGGDDYGCEFGNSFARSDNPWASDLIVALHRTIEAQVALLTICLGAFDHFERTNSYPLDEHKAALTLARAINGAS